MTQIKLTGQLVKALKIAGGRELYGGVMNSADVHCTDMPTYNQLSLSDNQSICR